MRKFLTGLVVIPLGVLFLVFAVANRGLVTVSFDPFNAINPAASITVPLFLVLILTGIVGVLSGSFATWLRQRQWRKLARDAETELQRTRGELADLRAKVATSANAEARMLAPPATPSLFGRDGTGV